MVLELSDSSYKEVLEKNAAVVIDFWAQWCGPCKAMLPILQEIADEYEGRVVVGKVDVDQNQDLCGEYGIMNIPTMLFFKNGQLVDRHIGACKKSDLQAFFDKLL